MARDPQLNGSDYLMLGFDRELRRCGYAGNACQIVLHLAGRVSPETLTARLRALWTQHPLVSCRPGGFFTPRWKPCYAARPPAVSMHRRAPGMVERILNQPLATHRGELMRLDLIEREDGRMDLVFTWSHALMDGVGGEAFLACLGSIDFRPPAAPVSARTTIAASTIGQVPLRERARRAWKYLHYLDQFRHAQPRTLNNRLRHERPALNCRVERFSLEETRRAREHGVRLCGVLGNGQFHAAVATVELHQLHQRLGRLSPSYVLPVPVSLRRKGTVEPVFGNQVTLLMFQFLPEQLATVASAITSLKAQTTQVMRLGLVESGCMLSGMFRFLPLPLYMGILKRGMGGEICSLFFGDTSTVNPGLECFLGVPVSDFAHVAAVTPSPGLGVIFYYFRGELRVTVVHSSHSLSTDEAAEFAAGLRQRLLNP
jgi:hypothetical protein